MGAPRPGLLLAAWALLAAPEARAEDAPLFKWDPLVDSVVLGGAAVTWWSMNYAIDPARPMDPGPGPDNRLDALAPISWPTFADPASDIMVYASLAGSLAVTGMAGRSTGDSGPSMGVVLQSFFLTGMLTDITKHAVNRPRPYTHVSPLPADLQHELESYDAYLSFPSGHTSFQASLAFSTAEVLVAHGVPRATAWAGATLLTATTGTLRVLSGRHYPTDVLAGAALGMAVGVTVPALHRTW